MVFENGIRGVGSGCLCYSDDPHTTEVLGKAFIVTAAHCVCIQDEFSGKRKFAS
jgi:hypothetical protein